MCKLRIDSPKCHWFEHFVGTMYTENWASLLLALNRIVALELPHYYQRILTRKVLTLMILLPWCIGMGTTLTVHYGTTGVDLIQMPAPYGFCASRVTNQDHGTILVAVGAYTPVSLMAFFYAALFYRLTVTRWQNVQRNSGGPGLPAGYGQKVRVVGAQARQRALAKMLIASCLWYCMFFLPGPVIVTAFPGLIRSYVIVYPWLRTMNLCGYAASPVRSVSVKKLLKNLGEIGVFNSWSCLCFSICRSSFFCC